MGKLLHEEKIHFRIASFKEVMFMLKNITDLFSIKKIIRHNS